MGDQNNPLSDAIKILESEPAKNLLSPVTKEIGEFLGTVANLARFYATENLERIFKRWASFRGHAHPLSAEEFKKVMPLLALASMVSDEELQERWAVLMESTATDEGCLPSFGQTLAQLTSEEVRYLDRLWKVVCEPTDHLSVNRPGREPLSYINLVQVFDPDINTGVNPAEWKLFQKQFTDEQKADYERFGRAELAIEDLIRLGIIGEDQVAEPDRYLPLGDTKIPAGRSQTVLRSQYSFSQYGVYFMQAVTPKSESARTESTIGRRSVVRPESKAG
jgi:hypothetical protein